MNPATVAVWREVRPQITSEQAREVLAQIEDARERVRDASTWSLAQWASVLAPHDPESARQAILRGLSRWAREQTDAREVLRAIIKRDRRAGVWCTCAVAETALRFVRAGEDRPRLAIETARRWVLALASREDCAANAAAAAAAAASTSTAASAASAAFFAAASAAYSVSYLATRHAAAAGHSAAGYSATARADASADADACLDHIRERIHALHDLCAVAADALLSLPAEDESQSTA